MIEQTEILKILAADYPSQIWFVPSCVLGILAYAAFADARTGRVPNVSLVAGAMGALAALSWTAGWFVSGERFLYAAAAVIVLRLANKLYLSLFGHDAFGYGDAKWTGLAVIGFGAMPVFWAWIVGAWLGLIWMGSRRLWQKFSNDYCGHAYVHFAPFLFLGLVLSLFKLPLISLF